MNGLHVKYLLVGGGLACSAAAQEIRRRDATGEVLLVAQEIYRPYHRPSLSNEYLKRDRSRADLATVPHEWFGTHQIELRTGRRVASLDTARSTATLDDGQAVSYDRLLLAVGATPNRLMIPGSDLPNIFYLRTLEDADRLQHAIDVAKRTGRRHSRGIGRGTVAIIGGGFLGTELASSLTQIGLHVELLIDEPHPWPYTAGEQVGHFIVDHLRAHDVSVHVDAHVSRLEGDGRAQRVVMSSGEQIECDFVIVAIGVTPNRQILRNTPIAAETAILVGPDCRTNVTNIFAAGDCSAVFDPLFGKHRLIDHWESAAMTGEIAGANMTGADERYDVVNHHVVALFGLPIHVWGERRVVHHRILRNSGPATFVEFGVAIDGRIGQVMRVGSAGEDSNLLERVVRSRLQASGRENALRDPTIPIAVD